MYFPKPLALSAGLLFCLGAIVLVGRSGRQSFGPHISKQTAQQYVEPGTAPAIFHLLFSFTETGLDLCRAAMSAVALGYPVPALFRLTERRIESNADVIANLNEKIAAIGKLNARNDDDMLLLAEGENTWFQLRPQILLSRYSEAVSRSAGIAKLDIAITLQSSARDLIVTVATSGWNKSTGNHGQMSDIILGSIRGVRTLLRLARDTALAHPELEGLGDIYIQLGTQKEMHIETLRNLGSFDGNNTEWKSNLVLAVDSSSDLLLASNLDETNHDRNEDSGSNASRGILGRSLSRIDKQALTKLPEDISKSRPPFWTWMRTEMRRDDAWEEQSLVSNPWTGNVPAIIVPQQSREGNVKISSAKHWSEMWFFRHLEILYKIAADLPEGPVAFAGGRYWWPDRKADENLRNLVDDGFEELGIFDVCGGEYGNAI